MLSTIGRAAVRRLTSRPATTSSVASRLVSRTAADQESLGWLVSSFAKSCALRSFATKAETTTTAKPTTRKKATVKASAKPKKAAAKPTKKKLKPKPKPKKKKIVVKKVQKKKPKPKVLTQEQKDALQLKAYKKIALYAEEPKALAPANTWALFISEHLKNTKFEGLDASASRFSDLGSQYRLLSSSELERLKSIVEKNLLINAASHKAWIESHPVQVIHDANNARHFLKRKFAYPKNPHATRLIKDDRQPRRTVGPYPYFLKARWASGDFNNVLAVDAAASIAAEWRKMSDAEKEPYLELSKADSNRYSRETEAIKP